MPGTSLGIGGRPDPGMPVPRTPAPPTMPDFGSLFGGGGNPAYGPTQGNPYAVGGSMDATRMPLNARKAGGKGKNNPYGLGVSNPNAGTGVPGMPGVGGAGGAGGAGGVGGYIPPGGFAGGAGGQAAALSSSPQYNYGGADVPPLVTNTERDPQLQNMYQEYGQYRGELASNTDQDAINAMQRQRDVLTGVMGEVGTNAAERGIGPDSGAFQELQADMAQKGARTLATVNVDNTSRGREMQLAALGGQTGAATSSAAALQAQQNFGLDTWNSQQRALNAAAQLQAMREQNMWGNQMGLLNFYTGLMDAFS